MSIPPSPETKKKKAALPSILSNIRNAQAVIGRATDDLHERETRPLMGGSGGGGSGGSSRMAPPASNRPQLSRGAPSSSLAATLQNFSQRFGSQWRKRSRRKRGGGVTSVPQSFYLAVGCFFFAFPLFFVLFILARHAVFGDESDSSQAHKHEVPVSSHVSFESGQELIDMNHMMENNNPEDEMKGAYIDVNATNADVGMDLQMKAEDDQPLMPVESAANELHAETALGNTLGQHDSVNDNIDNSVGIDAHVAEDSMKKLYNNTGAVDDHALATKEEFKSSHDLGTIKEVSESVVKGSSNDLAATNEGATSSDQVKEERDVVEEKAISSNFRRSHFKTAKKELDENVSSSDRVRDARDTDNNLRRSHHTTMTKGASIQETSSDHVRDSSDVQ